MKSLLFTLLITSTASQASEWMNVIRQSQVDSKVVWDMPVDPNGNSPSKLTLEEGGALFQLWTIKQDEAKDYLLDQRLVGTYLPSAVIRIETGDPYPKVHRTRADQSFKVHFDIGGLHSGINLPEASLHVLVEQHLAPYADKESSIDPSVAISKAPNDSGMIATNGTTTLTYPASSLPSNDPTAAMGEEHFVVHALADASVPQTQIASNFVQIWPVATGEIVGMKSGDTVRNLVPQLTLVLNDLYPSSTTYLQIYPGSARLGSTGTPVDGSVLVLDQDHGDDRTLIVDEWEDLITQDGIYTLEIVTTTPFGEERLSYIEFKVDRILEVNAQLGNIEGIKPSIPSH